MTYLRGRRWARRAREAGNGGAIVRIGIVTTVFAPNAECGGPVTVAGQHARELVSRGHEVTVFTSDLIAFAPRTHLGALECQDDGLTIRYFRSWAPRPRYPAVLARVAAGIRERATRLDVVHIHFAREVIPATTAAATRSLGIPTVLQPHGMLGNVAGIRGVVDRLWVRRALENASMVLALQDHERRQLERLAPGARIRILPNGIPAGSSPGRADGNGRHPKTVLFLARLHPRKRVLAFIEMARLLRDGGLDARYVIVGHDAGDRAEAERRVSALGLSDVATFVGGVPASEVAGWYEAADVYVLPAVDEPFGLTVLEAMRAGVPCVVTNACGIAETLGHAGAALVADPEPGSLAGDVMRILNDEGLARQLSEAGFTTIEHEFSLSSVVDRLCRYYDEVAA
jgi:glycosyltransferase involved in cell wall biosynthesis